MRMRDIWALLAAVLVAMWVWQAFELRLIREQRDANVQVCVKAHELRMKERWR